MKFVQLLAKNVYASIIMMQLALCARYVHDPLLIQEVEILCVPGCVKPVVPQAAVCESADVYQLTAVLSAAA